VRPEKRLVFLRPLEPGEDEGDLLDEARRFALHVLRTRGSLVPMLFLATEEGLLGFVPHSIANEAAKDQFAQECRLMAVAKQAWMCAMVMETWVASVIDGKLDDTPPSEALDRIEAVLIAIESRKKNCTFVQPVIRDRQCEVIRLSESIVPENIDLGGRFAAILPTHWPSEEESRAAAFLLKALFRG
jgi:hypothetical protein